MTFLEVAINLFYKHSSELTSILINNPEIITQAKKSLDAILPEIQSSIRTSEIVITQETKEVIEAIAKVFKKRDCFASLAKTNGVFAVIARSVATKQSQ